MKELYSIAVLGGALFSMGACSGSSSRQQQEFIDSFKKAFESKDEAALKSFLYTKDADPAMLEYYTKMLTSQMGAKITSITLRDLTPDEKTHAAAAMDDPNGRTKLPLKPVKVLVLKT